MIGGWRFQQACFNSQALAMQRICVPISAGLISTLGFQFGAVKRFAPHLTMPFGDRLLIRKVSARYRQRSTVRS